MPVAESVAPSAPRLDLPGGAAPASDSRGAGDALLVIVPGLVWGCSFLFIAEGLESVGPFGLTLFRILVGFVALACVPAARRPVPWHAWPAVAALGAIWIALPLGLYPFAEQRVTSAFAGMMNGALPLLTALVAALLARRLPARREVVGLGVGLGGAVLVAMPVLGAGSNSAFGVALVAAALGLLAVALNLARPLQQSYGALPVLWRAQFAALVLAAPFGARELAAARWTTSAFLSLLALGALGTGLAYAILATAAGRLGATRASSANFLIPGVALALGVLVRGESVAFVSVVGAAVSVAGARILHRRRSA